MPQLTVTDLSPDQHEAYSAVQTWLDRGAGTKPVLSLGGYAGSGKSTVVSILAHELLKLGPLAFACFTGKASSVLARKLRASGIDTANRVSRKRALEIGIGPRPYCGTIHGLVYAPCDVCMIEDNYVHTMGTKCRAFGAMGSEAGAHCLEGGCSGETGCVCDCSVCNPVTAAADIDRACLACDPPPPVKKDGPCSKCHGDRFFRRSAMDREYKLLILDEASMVDDHMLRDLLKYNIPILAVGDHGQLPPVKGVGSLMKYPDIKLEKIHRQAAGNPIIALSAYIRENGDISERFADGNHVKFLSKRNFAKWITDRFPASRLGLDPRTPEGILGTALVSWTNRQRVALNQQIRESLGLSGEGPKAGEAMICLKNAAPIYNGMRGVVEHDAEKVGSRDVPQWKTHVNFVEDEQREENVKMAECQFFNEKTIDYDMARDMGLNYASMGRHYDFGFAMTAHKMQGSQAPEVAVLMDGMRSMSKEDRTRWTYTAVTRAADKLVVVL